MTDDEWLEHFEAELDRILYGDGTGMDRGLLSHIKPIKPETVWVDKFEGINRKNRRAMKGKKWNTAQRLSASHNQLALPKRQRALLDTAPDEAVTDQKRNGVKTMRDC